MPHSTETDKITEGNQKDLTLSSYVDISKSSCDIKQDTLLSNRENTTDIKMESIVVWILRFSSHVASCFSYNICVLNLLQTN